MEIVGDKESASTWHYVLPQLSCLPPEIFEIILPQVGGCDCISLRKTCKRIKMMVDEMEMRMVPNIWQRYLYSDFSKECIESVMPWVKGNEGRFKDIGYDWKMIYSRLYNSIKQHKVFIRKMVQFPIAYESVTNISFAGSQLFIHTYCNSTVCMGLKHRLKPGLLSPITDLCYYAEDGQCAEVRCLEIVHPMFKKRVIFKPFAIGNQTNPIVDACRMMVESRTENFAKTFPLDEFIRFQHKEEAVNKALCELMTYAVERMPHTRLTLMQYDNKVLLCAFEKTIVFCHHTHHGSDSEVIFSETELPHKIKSVHRLGNLLVAIVHDTFNNVFTNLMHVDGSGMIHVEEWNQLYLPGTDNQITGEKVCDIDVMGYALVLVTDLGKVFLSSVEESSHDAIQRKLYLACEIERPSASSGCFVSLDLNNGFVVAILEENQNLTLLFAE